MEFYLIVLTVILLWTILNSMFLPPLYKYQEIQGDLVSVLVPLRNEERNIEGLISSLKNLKHKNIEFHLLDDQSTDQTWEQLVLYTKDDYRFTLHKGQSLPVGWKGKVYACHQLSTVAKGNYLLFLDADARVTPSTVGKGIAMIKEKKAGLITGFPRFPTTCFLSKLLVPLQHLIIFLHLPLFFANYTKWTSTTAAHGAFLFFKREDYKGMGGHEAIANTMVDDVSIARMMKASGKRVILANITCNVTCMMYETNRETWEGFKKNIFIGLNRSIFFVSILIIFYIALYIMPFVLLLINKQVALAALVILLLQRFYVDWKMKSDSWVFLLHPMGILSLVCVMLASMNIHIRKEKYVWKGRKYS